MRRIARVGVSGSVERRSTVTRAVNAAIVAAGAGLPIVTILRMDQVFSPDGYRDVIRYRGRHVAVRDIDGVHLNVAGTAIAASIVARALRGVQAAHVTPKTTGDPSQPIRTPRRRAE